MKEIFTDPQLRLPPDSPPNRAWARRVGSAPRVLRAYSFHVLAVMLGIALAFM